MCFKLFKYYRSDAALSLINTDDFIQQWQQLATGLSGYCRMQEADILRIWYRHYSTVFEPVIFTAFNHSNELVGFVGMIWDEENQSLKHAGHPEYHGWLAKPDYEVPFLRQVFRLVRDEFPIQKLFWSVLPPGLSFDAFNAASSNDMYITYEKKASPAWDLTDTAKLQKLLKSKSIRSKFNRYKRRGNLRFEVISEPAALRKVFHIVENQIDFRHEAINNVRPFKNDPIKIGHFCEQLTIPDTILPVCLWLDDQLLAFQLGIVSKDYVSLRMISFDPSESKQSPGTLLFIKLGEYLTTHGYKTYDLTPGLDSYKDRFSNTQINLYKPTIHFSKIEGQKTQLKQQLFNGSRKLLIDKLGVNIRYGRKWKMKLKGLPQKIRNAKKSTLSTIIKTGLALIKRPKLINLKQLNIPFAPSTKPNHVKIQQHEDLLKYKDTYPFFTRRDLLIDAQKKFAKGDVLYSVADDRKLLWYIWQKKVNGEIKVKNRSISIPEEGFLLYDCYQSSALNDADFINNISEILKLLNRQDGEHVYLMETSNYKTLNNGDN